ncbi:MAG: KpsF/GutQ family sugar-phosphate isomerase [Bacteroidetes bacterium]|nr:KpsF/GutQ family sugar-phosphate isomerase [Bacteroidota bacterium]
MNQQDIVGAALAALTSQQSSIELLRAELGETYHTTIQLIAAAPKVVTSGIGKSGIIARKLAATLNSINVPSVFLHPVEAAHGDSGLLNRGDVVILFSKSGETPEVVKFSSQARGMGCTTIAIVTRRRSLLSDQCDHVLIAPVERELDAHNILPTASTTVSLVLADLIAIGVSAVRGDTADDLRRSHPQGMIGAGLKGTVADVMHTGSALPTVLHGTSMSEALVELTSKGLGCVCVCDAAGALLGIITDGDVRRAVQRNIIVASMLADEIMTVDPTTISSSATLHEALVRMEQRQRQIGVLPVVDDGRCVGVLRLHDIARLQL